MTQVAKAKPTDSPAVASPALNTINPLGAAKEMYGTIPVSPDTKQIQADLLTATQYGLDNVQRAHNLSEAFRNGPNKEAVLNILTEVSKLTPAEREKFCKAFEEVTSHEARMTGMGPAYDNKKTVDQLISAHLKGEDQTKAFLLVHGSGPEATAQIAFDLLNHRGWTENIGNLDKTLVPRLVAALLTTDRDKFLEAYKKFKGTGEIAGKPSTGDFRDDCDARLMDYKPLDRLKVHQGIRGFNAGDFAVYLDECRDELRFRTGNGGGQNLSTEIAINIKKLTPEQLQATDAFLRKTDPARYPNGITDLALDLAKGTSSTETMAHLAQNLTPGQGGAPALATTGTANPKEIPGPSATTVAPRTPRAVQIDPATTVLQDDMFKYNPDLVRQAVRETYDRDRFPQLSDDQYAARVDKICRDGIPGRATNKALELVHQDALAKAQNGVEIPAFLAQKFPGDAVNPAIARRETSTGPEQVAISAPAYLELTPEKKAESIAAVRTLLDRHQSPVAAFTEIRDTFGPLGVSMVEDALKKDSKSVVEQMTRQRGLPASVIVETVAVLYPTYSKDAVAEAVGLYRELFGDGMFHKSNRDQAQARVDRVSSDTALMAETESVFSRVLSGKWSDELKGARTSQGDFAAIMTKEKVRMPGQTPPTREAMIATQGGIPSEEEGVLTHD